jgi:hypothetical protein
VVIPGTILTGRPGENGSSGGYCGKGDAQGMPLQVNMVRRLSKAESALNQKAGLLQSCHNGGCARQYGQLGRRN